MHRLTTFTVGLFLSCTSFALADGTVRGTVTASTGVAIAGAKVSAVGVAVSTATDAEGRYSLAAVPTGQPVLIVASAAGFESAEKWASAIEGRVVQVDFGLAFARLSESIEVTGEIPLLTTGGELGVVRLAPEQIAALPSLGERDIFRTMQLLPGISGSNETSSGLYVRGSTPDQTLVTYDGFTVYHVDHLFGYFTAFNMEAVEDVELRKGAYEARYGGRLASVMELHGRSGPKDRWTGGVTASMLSVSGTVSAPISGKGSLLLAGRRSFQSPLYNDILDLFGTNGNGATGGAMGGGGRGPSRMGGPGGGFGYDTTPASHFYDLNGRLWFELGPKDRVALSAYGGRDNLDNSSTFAIPEFTPGQFPGGGWLGGSGATTTTAPSFTISGSIDTSDVSRWTNRGASFTWSRQWSEKQRTQLVVAGSRYERLSDRETAGEITVTGDTTGFRTPNAAGASNAQYENNTLDDLTFGLDHAAQLGPNHRLQVGVQYTQNDVSYQFDTQAPGADAGRPDRPFGGPSNLSQLLDQSATGALLSGYLQDQARFGRLTVTPGLRLARFDRTNETYVEPRLSFGIQLNADFRLKGGYGSYTQVVNRVEREDFSNGNQEFWALSNGTNVPAARSRHLVGGASFERRSLLVDVEFFSKKMEDLSTFAPRLRPGEDVGQSSSDFHQGSGRARGLELLLQKKAGRHTGWVSYTLSRSELEFPSLEPAPYPASQDQTHELKLVDSARLGRWTLSGTWIFATGKPYTAATGVSTVEIEFPASDTQTDNRRQVGFAEFGPKNGARLPAYHRLDLALRYEWKLKGARGDVGVTVFNVYDRHNVWYKEFQAFDTTLVANDVTLMGRAVNAFVGLRF